MPNVNPFAEAGASDAEDVELVRIARTGSKEALESLIHRHQGWIYNIALRMAYVAEDAEDATQEILVKVITHLSTFRGESQFRTWLYRIAFNHMLNVKRSNRMRSWTFEEYGQALDMTPDGDLPDRSSLSADVHLYAQEARIGCSTGILLCLDAEQRLVYVLGAIFGVSDRVGAEMLEISRDSFRQKLSRARQDLHSFMDDKCGLVKSSNPCRCAKKTQGFINAGYLDASKLLFAREHVLRVREVAEKRSEQIEQIHVAYADVHRDHPFQPSPDFFASLRALIESTDLVSASNV